LELCRERQSTSLDQLAQWNGTPGRFPPMNVLPFWITTAAQKFVR
jgi:hypothetical protein